jgi:hypothetical protein
MSPSAPASDAASQPAAPSAQPGRRAGRRQQHDDGRVLALLRPGSFVQLVDHPSDLPPFQLIHCRGGRCWVRQQAWGEGVQWEVAHRRLTWAA